MCLSTLTTPKIKSGTGYMVRRKSNGKYSPVIFTHKNRNIGLGETLVSGRKQPINIDTLGRESYIPCFHVWRTLEGAKKWADSLQNEVILRVAFDEVVAAGTQCNHKVIVARKITYLKEVA